MNLNVPKSPTKIGGGVFISDLHLFSPRSEAASMPGQLAKITAEDRCIILGGDIFDFRWSIQGSHALTLQAALTWLEELLTKTGQAQIRFLPGNHDCHPDFLRLLDDLAAREHRFGWYEHHIQIGNCLFLHGDILDAGDSLAAYREKFHHAEAQSRMKQRLYDLIVDLRLHKVVPLVRHRPKLTCQRLRSLIDGLPGSSAKPFDNVFFGHTHVPMFGYQSDHVRYYNPGAALKYMRAHLQPFEFNTPQPIDDIP